MPQPDTSRSHLAAGAASPLKGPLLTANHAAIIRQISGTENLDLLVDSVINCGFDPGSYLKLHKDLQHDGLTVESALFHFLRDGIGERRLAPAAPLPDGLEELRLLPLQNQEYAQRLFSCVYQSQLDNPATVDRLWTAIDGGLIAALRRIGGVPYLIIGDSHTRHYVQPTWLDRRWLAPLPLACPGRSATSLNRDAPAGDGQRILDWAQAAVRRHVTDVPIFLKFGGIDSEYAWIRHRIRNRIDKFTTIEYRQFAQGSVAQYGHFIDRLAAIVDPAMLRICSVFPPPLPDDRWREYFVALHLPFFESNSGFQERLQNLDVPNLIVRTRLRALYNKYLKMLCNEKGLIFIDDFFPLIDATGVLDARYRSAPGVHSNHVNTRSCEAPLGKIIRRFVR